MTYFIGDVHGKFSALKTMIKNYKYEKVIQVGDMGLGFHPSMDDQFIFPSNLTFIRGNHDSPDVCRQQPNYLGDYGITDSGIFFVSGAWSIDQHARTEGVSWWKDEELSYAEAKKCLELYEKTKPDIVCSHDGPPSVTRYLLKSKMIKTRTGELLEQMLSFYQPKMWIFGHHHRDMNVTFNKTNFICLNELSIYKL